MQNNVIGKDLFIDKLVKMYVPKILITGDNLFVI